MAKKRSRSSRKPQAPRVRRAVPSGLVRLSVADLQREIRHRQSGVKTLHRRRAKALAKIAALDAQIMDRAGTIAAVAGLTARGTARKRPKNDTNLIDALRAVLKGKTMGPSEAAQAVHEAGYRSSSANFRGIVNVTLHKHKKHFKKVERGRYTAA